jgi:hypothetical protein
MRLNTEATGNGKECGHGEFWVDEELNVETVLGK